MPLPVPMPRTPEPGALEPVPLALEQRFQGRHQQRLAETARARQEDLRLVAQHKRAQIGYPFRLVHVQRGRRRTDLGELVHAGG